MDAISEHDFFALARYGAERDLADKLRGLTSADDLAAVAERRVRMLERLRARNSCKP
jgi:hypothetical protein